MIRDKVLEIVQQKGPVLPVLISKEITTSVLVASAMLGELVSAGKIKFSYTKFGGSPLYYVDGQESKLQQLYDQLKDMEKKSYDLLKKNKILRDKELEPAFRVAFRQIRDFAVPLEIDLDGNTEIFWKWYLSSNEEIKQLLPSLLEKIPIKPKIEEKKKEEIIEKKEKTEKPVEKIEKPIYEAELREKLRQELLKELRDELRKELLQKPIDIKELERLEKERKKKEIEEKDVFLAKIRKYCQAKTIKILDYEILKRKNEIELVVSIPSALGNITYYCKAKNKRKINDDDLNSAFLKGNQKKMPVLFLTTGSLIKKTQEKLNNEFRGISFKNVNNT